MDKLDITRHFVITSINSQHFKMREIVILDPLNEKAAYYKCSDISRNF